MNKKNAINAIEIHFKNIINELEFLDNELMKNNQHRARIVCGSIYNNMGFLKYSIEKALKINRERRK